MIIPTTSHYYGDIVRALFLEAAVIMLVGLPGLTNYLSMPVIFSIVGILILSIAAGITNPKMFWDSAINTTISIGGLAIFETYAVKAYRDFGAADKFFIVNMLLGLTFLLATYFSVKTFRGLFLGKKEA
ncbi:hypothetical protein KGQ24_01030 [Patescibacteria group bacterium]|nr:hypothetical protein [Patescibacteria group bacterium]